MASQDPPSELGTLVGAHSTRAWYTRPFWLIGIALFVGGGYYAWTQFSKPKEPPPMYVTEPLERGDLELTITATGNLEPTTEVTIGSALSGITKEVFVDINDRVKKDQPLATITILRLEQELDRSRASVNSAKARVNQVQATLMESEASLGRLEELHKLSGGRTPSKADMINAQATVSRSKADLESANAAVSEAEADLRAKENDKFNSVLKSPIDGIVLTRSIEPGQTVAASFQAPELFVLAENLEQMKLKVAVAEADIGRVKVGQDASFTVDAWPNRSYSAKVTRVSFGSAIVDNVVTYETELEVTNQDLSLRPGMTATADVEVAEAKKVLLVPTSALRFDPQSASSGSGPREKKSFVQSLMPRPPRRSSGGGGGPLGADGDTAAAPKRTPGQARIWTLKNGQPQPVTVQTGLTDGRHTEVTGDELVEGMPIITRANPVTP